MQRLDSLELPDALPQEKAIRSWGQNGHDYEPEFWEFHYEISRYLKNISKEKLIERYKDIHRNFHVLTGNDRHAIPINSFLSSWYWYKKEHQTRYEFLLRGIPLSISPPQSRGLIKKPFCPKSPSSCDILFRYGHVEHMKRIVNEGKIRISPASKYRVGCTNDPRTDDELNKRRWELGDNCKITTQDGKESAVIGDVKRTVSTSYNYYMLSLACDFEPSIFEQFNYDSCVVIKNPAKFSARLEFEAKSFLPTWYFHHNPTQYFDPNEPTNNQYFSASMCKDFRYAYQIEYRYLWAPLNGGDATDHFEVNLGPLNDICELYKLN